PAQLDATSIRIDHTFGSKFSVFGRYSSAPSAIQQRVPTSFTNVNIFHVDTSSYTVGVTALISPHVNNDFRPNYTKSEGIVRVFQDNFGGATPVPRNVLIPSQFDSPTAQGNFFLNFPGRTATSPPIINDLGGQTPQHQINFVDNVSYAWRSHQL